MGRRSLLLSCLATIGFWGGAGLGCWAIGLDGLSFTAGAWCAFAYSLALGWWIAVRALRNPRP